MAITDLISRKRNVKNVPVKRAEYDPFYKLQRNMNRLFDNFYNNFGLASFEPSGEWPGALSPSVDVTENDQEITVSAELPGLDEKDIEVSLAHNVLTVSGEKKEEKEDKGKDFYRMERSYGSFQRSVSLPAEVEPDKVEARFNKGVLTITLPKTVEAQKQTKRIPVKPANTN
jgi:HSP20 family protein